MIAPEKPDIYGESLGLSASIIDDGECLLSLTATLLHGGEGLNATFHNTSELFMDWYSSVYVGVRIHRFIWYEGTIYIPKSKPSGK